jgi:hypothetical protein
MIPLQQIRTTHHEEQPSPYLQFFLGQFGTVAPYPTHKTHHELDYYAQLPDAAKHSFSLKVAVHTIVADVGMLPTTI